MGRPKSEVKRVVIGATVLPEILIKLKEKAKENKTPVGRYAGDLLESCMMDKQPIKIDWPTSPSPKEGQTILDTNNEEKVIGKSYTSTNLKLPLRATDLFYYKGKQTRITALAHRQKISIEEVKKQLRSEGYE